jgi:hypothetical protein
MSANRRSITSCIWCAWRSVTRWTTTSSANLFVVLALLAVTCSVVTDAARTLRVAALLAAARGQAANLASAEQGLPALRRGEGLGAPPAPRRSGKRSCIIAHSQATMGRTQRADQDVTGAAVVPDQRDVFSGMHKVLSAGRQSLLAVGPTLKGCPEGHRRTTSAGTGSPIANAANRSRPDPPHPRPTHEPLTRPQ